MRFRSIISALAAAAFAFVSVAPAAQAQIYPYNNPTYIPTSTKAATNLVATGDYEFTTNGVAAVTFRLSGTRTSMTAAIQGTNDGTNWTTLQVIPVGGGSVATSITANGFWMVNTAGFTKVRFHVTAFVLGAGTGASVQAAGVLSPNAIYVMNPQAISGPVGVIGTDGSSTWDCAADGSCEVDLARVAGAAVATGAGTASGALRVELPTDGTGKVGLIAGTALVGKVGIDQTTPGTTNAVQALAGTTGGATPVVYLSAASTNATSVKASAGQVYVISAVNTTATLYYLKFYNTASAPTCNSDTPLLTIPVPASTSGGAITIPVPVGIAFSTGIGLCLTGAAAANDNTSAATGVVINVVYK